MMSNIEIHTSSVSQIFLVAFVHLKFINYKAKIEGHVLDMWITLGHTPLLYSQQKLFQCNQDYISVNSIKHIKTM